MPTEFKWKTSFVLHNVASKETISLDGLDIRPHPKSSDASPMVSVTYRFTTSNSPRDFLQYARDTVERFLDTANVNLALLGLDVREVMEAFDLEIENRKELLQAGMNPPSKLSFTVRNTSTWTEELVQAAWNWSKKLAAHRDAEILFRILRLLRQSMLEDDEYDRLSKVWRGFNAFYNRLAGSRKVRDPVKIKNFARSLYAKNSSWLRKAVEEYWTPLAKPTPLRDYLTLVLTHGNYVSVMDCLVKQDFKYRQRTNHSQNLAAAVSARDMMAALESSLLCIYVERNRVMHGETIADEERDLLYVCAAFLQRIVAIGLNEFYFIPLKASQTTP